MELPVWFVRLKSLNLLVSLCRINIDVSSLMDTHFIAVWLI